MANTTNIESLQAEAWKHARRQAYGASLRRLLEEYALQPPEAPTDYRGLLRQVQTVVTNELATLDAEAAQAEAGPAEEPGAVPPDAAPEGT